MANVNSSLNILLRLNGAQQFQGQLAGITSRLAGMLGVSVSLVAVQRQLSQALAYGSKVSDLGKGLGQSAGDIVILEKAMKNAGIQGGNLGYIISQLQQRITGLGRGAKGLGPIWEQLGLDPESLRSLTAIEQLERVGAAIRNIGDADIRQSIAGRLFGVERGAQALQLLLEPGAFARAREEVGGLAEVMDRSAEAFDLQNDRLKLFQDRLRETSALLVESILPAITALNNVAGASNPAVGAPLILGGAEVFALSFALKIIDKLDLAMLNWVERQGPGFGKTFGERFAGQFVEKAGPLITTGLKLALVAAIAYAIEQAMLAAQKKTYSEGLERLQTPGKLSREMESLGSVDQLREFQKKLTDEINETQKAAERANGIVSRLFQLASGPEGAMAGALGGLFLSSAVESLRELRDQLESQGIAIITKNAAKLREQAAAARELAEQTLEVVRAEEQLKVAGITNDIGAKRDALVRLVAARQAALPGAPDIAGAVDFNDATLYSDPQNLKALQEWLKLNRELLEIKQQLAQLDREIAAGQLSTFERQMGTWAAQMQGLTDSGNIAAQTLISGFDGVTSAIGQAVSGTQSWNEAFKNTARQFLAQIAEMIARAILFRSLMSVFPALGGLAGLAGTGTQVGAALADGGSISAGTLNLVGERGPELFVPRHSGTIVPSEQLGAQSDGMAVAFNFYPGVNPADFAMIIPQLESRIVPKVRDAMARRQLRRVY